MTAIDTEDGQTTSKRGEFAVDSTALRRLNLLFTLHVSAFPLSTEQILGNEDLGYKKDDPDSGRRLFLRDRKRLEGLGVFVHEIKDEGASEREESRWAIDRERTHARFDALTREDAEAVLAAIDEHFSLHGDDPIRWPLQRARAKLAEVVGTDVEMFGTGVGDALTPLGTEAAQPENLYLRHIWSAFNRRRAARFTYRDAQGNERARRVEVYAIFEQGRHTYVVGRCLDSNAERTFRADRIVATKKSPDSAPTYRIPKEFVVGPRQFLPFDFSQQEPVATSFSFPAHLGIHEIELITHRRGELSRASDASRWYWNVDVHNLDAAAGLVLEHAVRGMRAEAPQELVDRVKDRIRKVVHAHVA